MKLQQLLEEFRDYIKVRGKDYAIYINPTSEDYRELKKEEETDEVRFMFKLYTEKNEQPKLYAFNSEVLHYEAAEKFGIPYKGRIHLPIWGDYAFGISKIGKDNKLTLDAGILKEINRMGKKGFNAEFLQKYFSNF